MSTLTLFEHEQITVWYHLEKRIIHHQMHQYTYGQAFRDALMAGCEAMKKYRANKWLSDDRNNPVLAQEDRKWATDVWQPQVLEAGWKYWAIVQPEYAVSKLRMIKFAEMYSQLGITAELFSDPEDAMQWLESQ